MSFSCVECLFPSVDDTLEVGCFERSSTDESTVDVWLRKQFRSVACLAAAAIEDRCVVGNLLAILLSHDATDVCVYLLSLFCGSGLACSDSPDGLVSDNDLAEVLLREVEY